MTMPGHVTHQPREPLESQLVNDG